MKTTWKVGEILSILNKDGWFEIPSKGGHRQLKHPAKSGRVTVPGKRSDVLRPKTINSIFRQAQLKKPR